MDDRSLYATSLGLDAPWEVDRVELQETEQATPLAYKRPYQRTNVRSIM